MTRKLTKIGNSSGLILSRDLKDHLGVSESVEVILRDGEIVLRKPLSVREALDHTLSKHGEMLRLLPND